MKKLIFAKALLYCLVLVLMVVSSTVCFYLSNIFAETLKYEFLKPIAKIVSFLSFFAVAIVIIKIFFNYIARLLSIQGRESGITSMPRCDNDILPEEILEAIKVGVSKPELTELLLANRELLSEEMRAAIAVGYKLDFQITATISKG